MRTRCPVSVSTAPVGVRMKNFLPGPSRGNRLLLRRGAGPPSADEFLGQGEGRSGEGLIGHDVMSDRKVPIILENARLSSKRASDAVVLAERNLAG